MVFREIKAKFSQLLSNPIAGPTSFISNAVIRNINSTSIYVEILSDVLRNLVEYQQVAAPSDNNQDGIIGKIVAKKNLDNGQVKQGQTLAHVKQDSIECPIIESTNKSGKLSNTQIDLMIDFLIFNSYKSKDVFSNEPVVIEANGFDVDDLLELINKSRSLYSQTGVAIKLELPPMGLAKNSAGQPYDEITYNNIYAHILWFNKSNEAFRLQQIFKETKTISAQIPAPKDSELITIADCHRTPTVTQDELQLQPDLEFTFSSMDSIAVAKQFYDQSNSTGTPQAIPLVMNMANSYSIGGGVEKGAVAQEEFLFRCSNYFISLYKCGVQKLNASLYRYNILPQNSKEKPLKSIPHDAAFYTEDITVIRDANYKKLSPQNYFKINAVAIAGYNLKYINQANVIRYTPEDKQLHEAFEQDKAAALSLGATAASKDAYPNFRQLFIEKTKDKILLMLQIAHDKQSHNLVLGAISCGAFKLPTDDFASAEWTVTAVTEAYKAAFIAAKEAGLLKHLKKVAFGVLGTDPDPRDVNHKTTENNIKHFKQLATELQSIIAPSHKSTNISHFKP